MSHLTRSVSTTTSDGVVLHGLVHLPSEIVAPDSSAVSRLDYDVAVLMHGLGGNFYGGRFYEPIIDNLLDHNVIVLAVNNRGHDTIHTTAVDGKPTRMGAAYELVSDCVLDVQAWCDSFLDELGLIKGTPRVLMIGHSLGAVKALYASAHRASERITGLVSVSAPCITSQRMAGSQLAQDYRQDFKAAQELVKAGRGRELMEAKVPFPILICAASYVDKYGPTNHYDVMKLAEMITVPNLFVFGGRELDSPSGAFQRLPELLSKAESKAPRAVKLIEEADHFYAGQRAELAGLIDDWLTKANG